MPLTPGSNLGPYEILSPAGAGGMGEVYKARDTRLDRLVAVKILPSHLSSSVEARQRFEREARSISSLSHPHICALYDIGRQEGVDFLVMEYLEGETLQSRLEQGPLKAEQALRVAIEIASALEKAHRQGLIHRDLKPANVMLTRGGAKLLDFGLAKLHGTGPADSSSSLSALATGGRNLTAEGTILGTLQYMAPEQLEGKEADARTDIFAFGVLVYEMATGKKAFEGRSQASLIAAILKEEPRPISELQPLSPSALDRVIRTCLAKDPADRWQTAHDLALQLRWLTEGVSQTGTPATAAGPGPGRRGRLSLAATGVLFLALGLLGGFLLFRGKEEKQRVQLFLVRPTSAPFSTFDFAELSPDGRQVAFVGHSPEGRGALYLRPLDSLESRSLAGTEGASHPFWSPDGLHLGFFADGKIKKIDVGGGPPLVLAEAPMGRGGSWSRDGTILFAPNEGQGIHRVPASGGADVVVTKIGSGEEAHRYPAFLPDGRHFVFLADAPRTEDHHLKAGSLDSGETVELTAAVSNVRYADPGMLLFMRSGTLLAQPFDPSRLKLTGDPRVLARDLVECVESNHRFEFTLSETGVLAYRSADPTSQLTWVDRTGRHLEPVGPRGRFREFKLSPDGRGISLERRDADGRIGDLWLLSPARGITSRLTFRPGSECCLTWSPDGSEVVFGSARSGLDDLYRKSPADPARETLLLTWPEGAVATSWSPDGRSLLFESLAPATKTDIWILPMEGGGKPEPLIQGPFEEHDAIFSPDGKWIAYVSDESGREEVYLRPFPVGSRRYQVSTAGGTAPAWRGDAREVFFIGKENRLMSAEIPTHGPEIQVATPVELFPLPGDRFIPAPDGRRFLVDVRSEDAFSSPLTVVLNWKQEAGR
jgi:eukaryotic-like serine/threonine-protein kinase